jgi:N-acetylmannosamine-6-phosphate 2-epimerase/N-acetylmannosamine kinase
VRFNGRLIVSCQASEPDAFFAPGLMARFARAAVAGGAAGIRANGTQDVRSIREAVEVPIIGIQKRLMPDGAILITPDFESAAQLVRAGASAVALDCTTRGQHHGALDCIRRIKEQLSVPVMADIATVEEAVAAGTAGADFVLSTMRGYTADTQHIRAFQPEFIAGLKRAVSVPVIAEGRIATPAQARAAIEAGATAVIIGSAITRPHEIARAFAQAVTPPRTVAAAIDLGSTNTKAAVVNGEGQLSHLLTLPTPSRAGPDALLQHLKEIARQLATAAPLDGLGIATGGWIDPDTGAIRFATGNLPGWSGAPLRTALEQATGLPTTVENDANAAAIAEARFGAARAARSALCLTLGTGIGGAILSNGQLIRGAHSLAGAIGHIPVVPDGLPCTCGLRGCLEAHFRAEPRADLLAAALTPLAQAFDPELIVLGGGHANMTLAEALHRELLPRLMARHQRHIRVEVSPLGLHAGVLGAAAIVLG